MLQAFHALHTFQHAKAWAVPHKGAADGDSPRMVIATINVFTVYQRGFGGAFGLNV